MPTQLPTRLAAKVGITGIEIDLLIARIAKALYPDLRDPPEPTRAPRRVATHPDARAACSAPRVLVPA